MKRYLLLLILGTLLFVSCKKNIDEPAVSIHINFSKQSLEYLPLQSNKYFIYKDSATGNLDSVEVTQNQVETKLAPAVQNALFVDGRPAFYYQTITLLLSKTNGNQSTDWFYGIADASYTVFNYYGLSSIDTAGVWLLERNRSGNADKLYVFGSPSLSSNGSKTIIPNITVEGKTYTDVLQFTRNNGYPQNYLGATYYWAKGTGIIKRSITTGSTTQTWTLLKNG